MWLYCERIKLLRNSFGNKSNCRNVLLNIKRRIQINQFRIYPFYDHSFSVTSQYKLKTIA